MKIKVHRYVKLWIIDSYNVEDTDLKTIRDAINYDLDANDCDELWETVEELGPIEVYDENNKLLLKET